MNQFDPGAWSIRAAQDILDHFEDAAAVDTANYRECSFIIEAARLVLADQSAAKRIGEAMERPRGSDDCRPKVTAIDRAVLEILAWDELRGAPSKLPESLARLLANRMHALFHPNAE